MIYRHFRIQIVLRLLLIVFLGWLGFYVVFQTYFWLVGIWIGLAVIGLTIELIRYVERSYRELDHFLVSAKQHDFSGTYSATREPGVPTHIRNTLSGINEIFKTLRSEKESHFQYLQTVVEHIGVALICFDENHDVQLLNPAAQKLFHKPYLNKLEGLKTIDNQLFEVVIQIPTKGKELVKLGDHATLAIEATEFKLLDRSYKLVSFQNIKEQLEEQEAQSWQKLIRVLTHEIMNSVIPISTLSSVIQEMIDSTENGQLSDEEMIDLKQGLQTIEKRSEGLVNFVKTYKDLSQVYQPKFQEVNVRDLFERTMTLLASKLNEKNIQMNLDCSPALTIQADPELMEQSLINLMINAIDALSGIQHPKITLQGKLKEEGWVQLTVEDNGAGMTEEIKSNIFVPFYTTKTDGSGIGLSLIRQIIRLHKGSMTVRSQKNQGAAFLLNLRTPKFIQ